MPTPLFRRDEPRLPPEVLLALAYATVSFLWLGAWDGLAPTVPVDEDVLRFVRRLVYVGLSAWLVWWLARGARRAVFQKARFDAIADQRLVGVYLARGDRLIYANDVLGRMLGHPAAALLERPSRDFLDPAELGRGPAPPANRDGDGDGTAFRRFVARRSDGARIPLHVLRKPVELEDGPAWAGIVLDATHVEALEGRLLKSAHLETLGEITGSVTHDFSTLLTTMIGQLDLALRDLPADQPARTDLSGARDAARRAAALTGHLLTFTRDRMTGPRVLDVNASLRELSSLLASLTGSTIAIRYELEDSLPGIRLEPGGLDQVVVNLFVNAKQAVAGKGEIAVRTRALPRQGAARVAIEVEDNGHGMSREVMGRMFEPFFTTRAQGGGLGLATVREILDRAGGTIEVESEVGKGTLVRVLFPITEPAAASRPGTTARSGWTGARTVLVVDDEPAVRRVIVAALRRQGYQVVEASDGPEALALFLGDPAAVDMVISDVMLPGGSGVDLVQAMMDERPDLKALFVSGYSFRDLVQKNPALKRYAIIEKPFSIEELTGSVERVWGAADASASG